ncbi:MAG TPA: universal stress protein [Gemmatimonadales bacterium]|jgi:hypothetical protein
MDLRHILAGADESAAGREAVRTAVVLAGRASARVTVLRTIVGAASAVHAVMGDGAGPDDGRGEVTRLRRWLGADLLTVPGGEPVHIDIGFGIPGIEICRYADQFSIDLIVIGRKQRSQSARMLIGDTADAVARRSQVPCLFVPPGQDDVRSLLVALDGTDRGLAVLRQACAFAQSVGASLRVVTVERADADEPGVLASRLPVARTSALEGRARGIIAQYDLPRTELIVRRGDVVAEVLTAMDTCAADTLVIGYHRGGPPGILEAGSCARRLLHTTPSAVITIPL